MTQIRNMKGFIDQFGGKPASYTSKYWNTIEALFTFPSREMQFRAIPCWEDKG